MKACCTIKPYQSSFGDDMIEALYKGILTLETMEECHRFFEDICTIRELQSISQRFRVAQLLNGSTTYNAIEEQTGASSATISRISKCLQRGPKGYDIVFERVVTGR